MESLNLPVCHASLELTALALQKAWMAAEQCTEAKIVQREVFTYRTWLLKTPYDFAAPEAIDFPCQPQRGMNDSGRAQVIIQSAWINFSMGIL